MSATPLPAAATVEALSMVGDSAILLTVGGARFDRSVQDRLQALAEHLDGASTDRCFQEVVLGVNNLLVTFDPLHTSEPRARVQLLESWRLSLAPSGQRAQIEIPVTYGGADGEDLSALAAAAKLSIDDYVRRHSEAVYTVACIGAYPGFAFMSGLPADLAAARRATPRLKLKKGSVIVGGVQAGVMPCTAPSGWHVLGSTDVDMFDIARERHCLVKPVDRVRFTVKEIDQ